MTAESMRAFMARNPEYYKTPERRARAAELARLRRLNPEVLAKEKNARQRFRNHKPATYVLTKARDRAKVKGLEFDLTEEWVATRLSRCAVTGLPFDMQTGTSKQQNPWAPSVDRIDSSKGYTQDNCRIVVWIYNAAKSSWGDEEVMILAEALLS